MIVCYALVGIFRYKQNPDFSHSTPQKTNSKQCKMHLDSFFFSELRVEVWE